MAVSLKQLMQTSPMPRCEQQDATSRRRSCRPTPRGRCGKSRLAQRSGGRCEQRVTFCQNERQPACQNEMMTVTQALENIGAGEGNRTLVISLEGCCSTIELHPRTRSSTCEPAFAKAAAPFLLDRPHCQPQLRRREGWWGREDSNLRRRQPADLQSAPSTA